MSSSTETTSTTGVLTTAIQYATIAAIGYGVYYSRQRNNARQAPSSQADRPAAVQETRSEKSAKKQRVKQFAQEAASQKQAPQKAPTPSKQNAAVEEDSADEELDNKEFARQLASLKEGKTFTAKGKEKKKKQKSVKQSQARAHQPAKATVSPPSSTGGIDADDDQSPPASPQAAAADAGGVGDMLEAPGPGPASLRIVPSETNKPQKAKSQKQEEAPLTKKQRQRRKKAEAAKADGEDAEKERKALLEKQRRLARISEGRAAKDGSQFMAATNGSNAWNSGKPNGVDPSKPSTDASAVPLLDTFSEPASAPAVKQATAPGKAGNWISSVPSEEKQLELLKSETEADEWNTVTSKKAKKPSTPNNEKAEDSSASIPEKAPKAAQPVQEPKAAPAPYTNGKPAVTKSFGAFAALSTNEPEEEEQEWDV